MSCGFPSLAALFPVPSIDLGVDIELPDSPDLSFLEDLGLPLLAITPPAIPIPSEDLDVDIELPDPPDLSFLEDLGLPIPAIPVPAIPIPSEDLGLEPPEIPTFGQLPCPFDEAA